MTELEVTVSVYRSDEKLNVFKESYVGNLSSMLTALEKIKKDTNDCLTELVNKEKESCKGQSTKDIAELFTGEGIEDNEAEDVEDFIDSEIKKEIINLEQTSSHENLNQNNKRMKRKTGGNKRLRRCEHEILCAHMDGHLVGKNESSSKIFDLRSIYGDERKAEIKKKLMIMEAAMPAILAWNMFQICQTDGISPAAAARKILQMDVFSNREEDSTDESTAAVLQKLEDIIHYQRKLRMEFEKAEKLSEFRDKQLKRRVLDLEMKATKNRIIFDEMIADLKVQTCDSSKDMSLDSISSHDLVAFEEMQRLVENEVILKKRIDELEKKEKIYLKTLEQADELWTALKLRTP